MKILVYGLSSQKGGVESFIINYCTEMARLHDDLEFEFLVFDEVPPYASPLEDLGFAFRVVPSRVRHPLKNRTEIKHLIEAGGYDGVWCHVCTLSDVTLLELAKLNVPLRVVHSHNSVNMGNILNGILHRRHKKQIPTLATDLFTCSQEASSFMFPNNPGTMSVRTIANGIDVALFEYDEDARARVRRERGWEDKRVFITVGRMHKQKNPLFLVDVFKELHAVDPSAHLAYIGDGSMRGQIVERVADYGLEEHVTFLGAVDDVADYLSAADVFVLPSLYEGLPFAAVEAQAAGLPVVMSDGVSEEAIMSDDVVRLPLGDAVQWAKAILKSASQVGDRRKGVDAVRGAGFDIRENARELGEWFLENTR